MTHGDICDVRAPDLIRPVNRQSTQQMGVDLVLRVWGAQPQLQVNRCQPDLAHQPPHPLARYTIALQPEVPRHLAAAEIGRFHELLVDQPHQ